jgi:hypothetical protein
MPRPARQRTAAGLLICTRCKRELPLTEFYLAPGRTDGYRPHCKECGTDSRLRQMYNITLVEYLQMWMIQGGCCAICRQPDGTPRVDHDHACCPGDKSCGRCVRGLLCHRCNVALGLLDDDPERLASAILYLTPPG